MIFCYTFIMTTHKDLPILLFCTFEEWLDWLETNHQQAEGLWIKFAKKASGLPSISYEEAREGALMYGWIDGLKNALDGQYYALRFTPRRSKSIWSKINCKIVEDLLAAGKMQPLGFREMERAQADGRWAAAYDSSTTMEVPEDFRQALQAHPLAKIFFETLSRSNRYAFIFRIQTAKLPQARAKHVLKAIDMLSRHEVYHPNG